MKTRIVATILWFYAGWCTGVVLADLFSISDLLGVVMAISAGTVVALDPRRIIWGARSIAKSTPRNLVETA